MTLNVMLLYSILTVYLSSFNAILFPKVNIKYSSFF